MNALEVANAALEVADGEAERSRTRKRSGLARFAASEVHQPTLIENLVVTLRIVRGQKAGIATTNKIDRDGLEELARRASEAADNAPPDDAFPGSPRLPTAGRWKATTTRRRASARKTRRGSQQRRSRRTPLPSYGFFTSGVSELAVASTTGLRSARR